MMVLPSIIVACQHGVFIIDNNSTQKVLESKGNYGVTFKNDWCYMAHRNNGGEIYAYKFGENFDIVDSRCLMEDLHHPHQIDFVDETILGICNTYNNEIILLDVNSGERHSFFPTGKIDEVRRKGTPIPTNYSHFNSIYRKNHGIYLVAHNGTRRTGKQSQLLEGNFETGWTTHNLYASNAHNIAIHDSRYFYCDSLNGTLLVRYGLNERPNVFFKTKGFSRGLAITKECIVLGESSIGEAKDRVAKNRGFMHFLTHCGSLISTIPIEGVGQIHEIRAIGQKDFGLSYP